MSVLTAYNKFIQQALKYGFSLWGIPKTGQTTSYRTGDDGDLEKGYPETPPRFTDNDDGTITDNATGLMWVKQPENIGGIWVSAGQPVKRFWDDAIDDCLALNYAGHSDWRLPNIKELASIIDYGEIEPVINPIFTNTKNGDYWSGTTYANWTTTAYDIFFLNGEGGIKLKDSTSSYVRPVRLGVPKD